MSTEQPTLIEFLEKTHSKVRIFDMGRRIVKISRQFFLDFEKTKVSYPYALQGQAWFAICIQSIKTNDEPVVWFLKLPLDEQGKLLQASRDYFLHRLLEAVAEDLASTEQLNNADIFKDNPHVFKPREERMAVFHAKLSQVMKVDYSRFYDHAVEYFNGKQGWDQWRFVGYQGIAEIAIASTNNPNMSKTLAEAIAHLPEQPLSALSQCLENVAILSVLTKAIIKRLEYEIDKDNIDVVLICNLIRGLSLSQDQNSIEVAYEKVLSSTIKTNIEVLAAVSGRAWQTLNNPKVCSAYLEALTQNDAGEQGFNECLKDLFKLPDMRAPLLNTLVSPEASEALQLRFQNFTQNLKNH